ncbi:MAG: hypothetical protein ACPGJV_13410 [Bacteriovoracaceae bacterium]
MKAHIAYIFLFLIIGCTQKTEIIENDDPPVTSTSERTFYMGYTTWDFGYGNRNSGENSQTFIYDKVKDGYYADIGALHYLNGLPWGVGNNTYYKPEDLDSFNAYSSYFNGTSTVDTKAFLRDRIVATAPLKVIYLAIDALNTTRNALTYKYGTGDTSYTPTGGSDGDFHIDEIHYSYANYAVYALWLIYDYYTAQGYDLPKVYFNYGSEASDLSIATNGGSQTRWNNFETFAKRFVTYMRSYTHGSNAGFTSFVRTLEYMFSIVLRSPGSTAMTTLTNYIADSDNSMTAEDITDYMDLMGVSTYGYLFYDDQWGGSVTGASTVGNDKLVTDTKRGNPGELPNNWLSQVQTIAPGMRYGITETGWIGEDVLRPAMLAMDGDSLVNDDYLVTSNETYQNDYVRMTLEESQSMNFEFIIFFALVDYEISSDYFDNNPPYPADAAKSQLFINTFDAWLKTGFYKPKSTLDTYNEYLNYSGDLETQIEPRPAWDTWKNWYSRERSNE